VPKDRRKAEVALLFRKEDPGNYRPVRLTLIPEKVMEQLILETISSHMKDKKLIRNSQHGFITAKSCLTNLITFYDEMTGLVDNGRAVDIVHLDISRAFGTVCLIEKLMQYGLDEQTVRWIENWLNCQAQRVVINGRKSSGGQYIAG